MADKRAALKLTLDAGQLKSEAVSAVTELSKLKSTLRADAAEAAQLKKSLANLRLGDTVDFGQYLELASKLKQTKQRLAENTGSFEKLRAAITPAEQRAVAMTARQEELRKSARALGQDLSRFGGPLGALGGRFAALSELAGSSRLAMIGVGVGALAVAGSSGYAAVKLLGFATAASEAHRAELAMLSGAASAQKGLTSFAAAGLVAQDAVGQVARRSSLSREAVGEYASELLRAGVSSENLRSALRATATVAATQGKEAATAFIKQAAALDSTSGAVDKLGRQIDSKLGAAANAALLSSATQAAKLSENVASMFVVDTSPLDVARARLYSLMDPTTAFGSELRSVAQWLGSTLVSAATNFTTLAEAGFLQLGIGALKLQTFWLELKLSGISLWKDTTAFLQDHQGELYGLSAFVGMTLIPTLWGAAGAGWGMARGLAASGGSGAKAAVLGLRSMAASAWAAVPAMWAATVPMLPFIAAAGSLALLGKVLYENWDELGRSFSYVGEQMSGVGRAIIDGLVGGLKRGLQSVKDAVTSIASTVTGTLRRLLGIASPSKVYRSYGENLVLGLRGGLSDEKPALTRDLARLVAAPNLRANVSLAADMPASVGGAGGSSDDAAVSFRGGAEVTNNFTFHITAASPLAAAERVREAVVSVFRDLAVQRGLA